MKKIAKASVRPARGLDLLSHQEIADLLESDKTVFSLYRECALAVLSTGSETDDAEQLMEDYSDFDIRVIPQSRGLKLEVLNAPASAFVDGRMIRGIQDSLFSALRDIVYADHKIMRGRDAEQSSGAAITDTVFQILRNADIVRPNVTPNLVVCWGGHSIKRGEYDYSKEVGYQLGLRGLDIATGCGIGAMKGPMKGATIGHAKQQNRQGRYIGITEPGIIASESPNPIVNELVILPDIEKRLEAFVRLAHCIIVFPGGAGTAEEVLYILSILMHPKNKNIPFPLIFAAPEGWESYFQTLDKFIRNTLGDSAASYYTIITGKPDEVARAARSGVDAVRRFRRRTQESYCFNWQLTIDGMLQRPFIPTHANMESVQIHTDLSPDVLAAQMRQVFSAIVAGNVKAFGIEQVRQHGPYKIRGDADIMSQLDALLKDFVSQGRMRIGDSYTPCYELV